MNKFLKYLIGFLILIQTPLYPADFLTIPYSLQPRQLIRAAQIMANYNALRNGIIDGTKKINVAQLFISNSLVVDSDLDISGKDLDLTGSVQQEAQILISRSSNNLATAIATATANASTDYTLIVDRDATLTSEATIPSNIHTIKFLPDYGFNNTATVNFTGQFLEASVSQNILKGSGAYAGKTSNIEFYPEWLGAIKNDDISDISAINTALTLNATVRLSLGQYDIDSTIIFNRGNSLLGSGMNDSVAGKSSKINLMDNSDCKMLETEYARNGLKTHYYRIENILFEGNADGQTTENIGIDFQGAYVMSLIRNVLIGSNRGTALLLQNGLDVQIDHLWVLSTRLASTANYAVEINPDLGSGQDGLLSMNYVYIENPTNKLTGGDPRNVPADRANGLLVNRLVRGAFENIHFEGCLNVVDIGDSHTINFESVSGIHLGYTSIPYDGFFRLLDSGTEALTIQGFEMADTDGVFEVLQLDNGVSSNDIPTVGDVAYLSFYSYGNRVLGSNMISNNPDFINTVRIERVGSFSSQSLTIQTDADVPTQSHYIKGNGNELIIGSDYNQADGTQVNDFMTIISNGNPGDVVEFNEPLSLATRENANNVPTASMYTRASTANAARLLFANGQGTEKDIPIVYTGTAAPTDVPYFVGQIFIDTTNDNAYIAVGTSLVSEWKQINNP